MTVEPSSVVPAALHRHHRDCGCGLQVTPMAIMAPGNRQAPAYPLPSGQRFLYADRSIPADPSAPPTHPPALS